MKKIYFTYRRTFTNRTNRYDISYYNDKIFADYKQAWLTEMVDWDRFISEDRITKEVVPWIKWLRRAWMLKYQEGLDIEKLKKDLLTTTWNFLTDLKTDEEMKQWIKDNTDLKEIEPWKFEVSPEREDELEEWLIPAVYLVIE